MQRTDSLEKTLMLAKIEGRRRRERQRIGWLDGITDSMKPSESESCSVVSDSLRPYGPYNPWNSPGQNAGVGNRSLLQGSLSNPGMEPGLLHCWRVLYQLSHQGNPRILECVVEISQVALVVKNLPANAGYVRDAGSILGSGRRRAWQLTPVFLPGKSHGQRSLNLAGYSP